MLAKMMLIDMHGAFSGQVLSNINIKGLASESYANIVLNRNQAVGEVNYAILNANDGSVAYGHPFGVTGARVISRRLYELQQQHMPLVVLAWQWF